MGYYTDVNGEIYYGNMSKSKQEVIEKIIGFIEFVQWGCSASYNQQESIDYYTDETEWIHFAHVNLDKDNKKIIFADERKDYNNASETLLHFIAPYLSPDGVYEITFQGEDEDEEDTVFIKNNKVLSFGKEFKTKNTLSFPLPTIRKRY